MPRKKRNDNAGNPQHRIFINLKTRALPFVNRCTRALSFPLEGGRIATLNYGHGLAVYHEASKNEAFRRANFRPRDEGSPRAHFGAGTGVNLNQRSTVELNAWTAH